MTSNLNLLSQQKVDSEHEAEVSGLKLLLHLTNMNFVLFVSFLMVLLTLVVWLPLIYNSPFAVFFDLQ